MNKAIHAEVKDMVEHTTTDYHLDVVSLKSYGLWTTRTIRALPKTQYIDSIHLSLGRLVGA